MSAKLQRTSRSLVHASRPPEPPTSSGASFSSARDAFLPLTQFCPNHPENFWQAYQHDLEVFSKQLSSQASMQTITKQHQKDLEKLSKQFQQDLSAANQIFNQQNQKLKTQIEDLKSKVNLKNHAIRSQIEWVDLFLLQTQQLNDWAIECHINEALFDLRLKVHQALSTIKENQTQVNEHTKTLELMASLQKEPIQPLTNFSNFSQIISHLKRLLNNSAVTSMTESLKSLLINCEKKEKQHINTTLKEVKKNIKACINAVSLHAKKTAKEASINNTNDLKPAVLEYWYAQNSYQDQLHQHKLNLIELHITYEKQRLESE